MASSLVLAQRKHELHISFLEIEQCILFARGPLFEHSPTNSPVPCRHKEPKSIIRPL